MKSKTTTVLSIGVTLLVLLWATPGAAAAPLRNAPARTQDTVAATAATHVISISAAAFTPYVSGYGYADDGRTLKHYHISGNVLDWGVYYAPVFLPHGATVTKMTFSYRVVNLSDPTYEGEVKLQRSKYETDSWDNMATIDSTATGTAYASDSTSSIVSPTIDNSQYTYWVLWELPWVTGTNDVWGCGVTIEYIPPATVTGILSIPAAAFTPFEDGYTYENDGRYLFTTVGKSGAYGWYYAPVNLPQGAIVTKMTFHYYDANAFSYGTARLQRTKLDGSYDELANVQTLGAGGWGSNFSNPWCCSTIDNSQYAYWVVWDIPVGNDLRGCAVVIEYTLPTTGSNAGVISISAAPFRSEQDGYDYENDGRYLQYFHDPNGTTALGSFVAPVQLPQGATVTKVTYYYNDTYTGGNGGGINLQRTHLGYGTYANMAGIGIGNFDQGYSSYSTDTIAYATIDNSQYGYWVVLDNLLVSQGGKNDWLCGVVIEYAYDIDLPLILR